MTFGEMFSNLILVVRCAKLIRNQIMERFENTRHSRAISVQDVETSHSETSLTASSGLGSSQCGRSVYSLTPHESQLICPSFKNSNHQASEIQYPERRSKGKGGAREYLATSQPVRRGRYDTLLPLASS